MSRHDVEVHQLSAEFGNKRHPFLNVLCADYHWLGVHGHVENGIHFLGRSHFGSLIFICLESRAQLDLLMERYPPRDWTWMEIETAGPAKPAEAKQ